MLEPIEPIITNEEEVNLLENSKICLKETPEGEGIPMVLPLWLKAWTKIIV